jgi:hypothetical protein
MVRDKLKRPGSGVQTNRRSAGKPPFFRLILECRAGWYLRHCNVRPPQLYCQRVVLSARAESVIVSTPAALPPRPGLPRRSSQSTSRGTRAALGASFCASPLVCPNNTSLVAADFAIPWLARRRADPLTQWGTRTRVTSLMRPRIPREALFASMEQSFIAKHRMQPPLAHFTLRIWSRC